MDANVTWQIADWVIAEGLRGSDEAQLLAGMCERMVAAGLPIMRANIGQRTLHPTVAGSDFEWWRDMGGPRQDDWHRYGTMSRGDMGRFPFFHMHSNGLQRLRVRLDVANADFPLLETLRSLGATDYLALTTTFGEGDARGPLSGFNSSWATRDVEVGRHVPVSPGALPVFLERFEQAYRKLGRSETILAAAAAHHRLLWIHPFLDGNGRVARLMSHAMLLEALDTGGIWSIARGLARNEGEYKRQLMACDQTRRNDLDGRGTLSEEALAEFTSFFLATCIDQVRFIEELVQPERLRDRILIWTEEEVRASRLPQEAGAVLEAVLYRGELPRGDVAKLLATSERQARRVTSGLLDREVLVSESTRTPLRLAFPARLASRWMPGLFPERRD